MIYINSSWVLERILGGIGFDQKNDYSPWKEIEIIGCFESSMDETRHQIKRQEPSIELQRIEELHSTS